ncbi:MAG: poly-gamma-glutamate biosynthesis protein PgsC [Planctomycetota bacterium]
MDGLALSIGIGLAVSLLFTEAFGLSVGGMIVPGYLAVSLDQPTTIVATIASALLTAGLVAWIDRWAILFGRRRVVITMVAGFAVSALLRSLLGVSFPISHSVIATTADLDAMSAALAGTTVIGFVIPGLIALWISRSGVVQTLSPLLVASSLVHLALVAIGLESLPC